MPDRSLSTQSGSRYADVRFEVLMRSTPLTRAFVDRLVRRLARERPGSPVEYLSTGNDLHIVVHIPPEWRAGVRTEIHELAENVYGGLHG